MTTFLVDLWWMRGIMVILFLVQMFMLLSTFSDFR